MSFVRFCLKVVLFLAMVSAGCENRALTPSPAGDTGNVELVESGWSFGFCLGPCRGILQIDSPRLVYEVSDRTASEVFATNRGSLTARGQQALASLARSLPENLLATYGCPDCADGGAAYVVVRRAGESDRSAYEYPSPPAELIEIDAFLKGVMEAMGACRSTADVTVEPGCRPLPD